MNVQRFKLGVNQYYAETNVQLYSYSLVDYIFF